MSVELALLGISFVLVTSGGKVGAWSNYGDGDGDGDNDDEGGGAGGDFAGDDNETFCDHGDDPQGACLLPLELWWKVDDGHCHYFVFFLMQKPSAILVLSGYKLFGKFLSPSFNICNER